MVVYVDEKEESEQLLAEVMRLLNAFLAKK